MPTPQDVVSESLRNLKAEPLLAHLQPEAWEKVRLALAQAVAHENEACMINLWNACEGKERNAMVSRFAEVEKLLEHNGSSSAPASCMETKFWTRWYPGLDTDHLSVGAVLDTMPGVNSEDIPSIISAFENPSSPLKLPGACNLDQHDVLHVLLGRGLVDQDEAFVLGFTATADPQFTDEDMERYKFAFSLYPEPYCIRGCDLVAFELGIQAARRMRLGNIIDIDVASVRDQLVGKIRSDLGIDKEVLFDIYDEERRAIPTPWSKRLPRRGKQPTSASP